MAVLKVQTAAFTASFRYPRVQVGMLPTFETVPPASLYGYIASAVGDWFDPRPFEFAYVFEHQGKAQDLETSHPIERGSGKNMLKSKGWNYPINLECKTNIQSREFLIFPKLTLYLRAASVALLEPLRDAFGSPHFSHVLGRSQDLAHCGAPEFVELGESANAFFNHTILPFSWRQAVLPGRVILLPTQTDYTAHRQTMSDRYLHVTSPTLHIASDLPGDCLNRKALPETFAVDEQDQKQVRGVTLSRGVHFFALRGGRHVDF